MPGKLRTEGGSTPVPDPTLLTTAALNAGLSGLREILEARTDGQKAVFEARFNGMDRAITLLQDIANQLPAGIETKVGNLRSLHEEKFSSIQTQFKERDVRSERESKDNKVAVDAALQAAKEAVGKHELTMIKQIDQINATIVASTKALDDKINDVKERMTRVESEDKGHQTAVTTQQTSNMNLVSVIGLVLGTLIGVGGIAIALMQRGT